MSRTYRNPSYKDSFTNLESYIKNRSHCFWFRPYKLVKKLKPKEVYEAELIEAKKKYEEEIKTATWTVRNGVWGYYKVVFYNCFWRDKNNVSTFVFNNGEYLVSNYDVTMIRIGYVPKYIWEREPQSFEEYKTKELEDNISYWNEMTRDGRFSESGRRKSYKKDAARVVRTKNKRLTNAIISGNIDYEDEIYPSRKDGKSLYWNYF